MNGKGYILKLEITDALQKDYVAWGAGTHDPDNVENEL